MVQTTAAEARFQAIYRAEPARPVLAERQVLVTEVSPERPEL